MGTIEAARFDDVTTPGLWLKRERQSAVHPFPLPSTTPDHAMSCTCPTLGRPHQGLTFLPTVTVAILTGRQAARPPSSLLTPPARSVRHRVCGRYYGPLGASSTYAACCRARVPVHRRRVGGGRRRAARDSEGGAGVVRSRRRPRAHDGGNWIWSAGQDTRGESRVSQAFDSLTRNAGSLPPHRQACARPRDAHVDALARHHSHGRPVSPRRRCSPVSQLERAG